LDSLRQRTEGRLQPGCDGCRAARTCGIALAYASLAEGKPTRAKTAYDSSDNMTVMSQALQVLVHQFPGSR
jgi:aminopeptidase N